jgi:hypothetical protein
LQLFVTFHDLLHLFTPFLWLLITYVEVAKGKKDGFFTLMNGIFVLLCLFHKKIEISREKGRKSWEKGKKSRLSFPFANAKGKACFADVFEWLSAFVFTRRPIERYLSTWYRSSSTKVKGHSLRSISIIKY